MGVIQKGVIVANANLILAQLHHHARKEILSWQVYEHDDECGALYHRHYSQRCTAAAVSEGLVLKHIFASGAY